MHNALCALGRASALKTACKPVIKYKLLVETLNRARAFSGSGEAPAETECVSCLIDDVPGGETDLVTDALLELGATTISICESREPGGEEQVIYQEDARKWWNRCRLAVDFFSEKDPDIVTNKIHEACPALRVHCNRKVHEDKDWVAHVKSSYKPMKVARDMWVCPAWSEPLDPGANNIILEPGLAFGTGDHPTTQMCMEALSRMNLKGQKILDYGTGSGVLALGALLYGAEKAVGVDCDAMAVKAAKENAQLNGLENKFVVLATDESRMLEEEGGFDVCVANILKGPLIELAPQLAGYVRDNGIIVLSGVLREQVSSVMDAYNPYFKFETSQKDDWVALVGVKQA